jgi:hypothetical protein
MLTPHPQQHLSSAAEISMTVRQYNHAPADARWYLNAVGLAPPAQLFIRRPTVRRPTRHQKPATRRAPFLALANMPLDCRDEVVGNGNARMVLGISAAIHIARP